MELTLLGTGTCLPSANRNSSGFVIKSNKKIILLDCGSGILRRLVEAKIDYQEIDVICLSHFHPDHVSDLAPFFLALKYTPDFAREKPLTLIGPVGLKDFLSNLANLYGDWVENPNFSLHLKEIEEDCIVFDSLKIFTKKMAHSKNSVGFRIESDEKKSITYSGDTGFCPAIIELANQTDLLLIGCSFPHNKKMAEHLTPEEVGRIADAAGAKKVVLIHMYPVFKNQNPVNQVSKIFKGETIKGRDFLKCYV